MKNIVFILLVSAVSASAVHAGKTGLVRAAPPAMVAVPAAVVALAMAAAAPIMAGAPAIAAANPTLAEDIAVWALWVGLCTGFGFGYVALWDALNDDPHRRSKWW